MDYKGLGISVLGKISKIIYFAECRCLIKFFNKSFYLAISAPFLIPYSATFSYTFSTVHQETAKLYIARCLEIQNRGLETKKMTNM